MKRNVVFTGLLLAVSILLIIAGAVFDRVVKPDAEPYIPDSDPYIEVLIEEDDPSLVGPVVEEWAKWETSAVDLYQQYRSHMRTYTARTLGLQWGVFDIPQGSFITKQHFDLATNPSFENASRLDLKAGERSVELAHLFVDTQYFFRITLELDNGQTCVKEGNFRTQWSPRIIEFDNLQNIRDIGGWKTVNGKAVKQGLLYRGCELDGATNQKCVITDAQVDIMVQDLKIKTELDLRSSDTAGVRDMLGRGVTHRYIALPTYSSCFTESGDHQIRLVFANLAQEQNYPMYLHCTSGTDRTGIVCFLFEALLGVSEEDCYREWELSALANGHDKRADMEKFMEKLRENQGDTLKEKTENYLLSVGVTAEEIEAIRTLFLG